MRKTLNENPVVQVVMLGILGIIVAFLFMTRVMGGDKTEPPTSAAPATSTQATGAPTTTTPAPATAPVAPTATDVGSSVQAGFEAGAGLPEAVVKAHESGDVVALLVLQEQGIEDAKLKSQVDALRSRSDTTVFISSAKDVTRYSRIAEGVDLDRVPALVAIHPPSAKGASSNGLPLATISYGFRGQGGVRQAIADALYKGKELPYHPG